MFCEIRYLIHAFAFDNLLVVPKFYITKIGKSFDVVNIKRLNKPHNATGSWNLPMGGAIFLFIKLLAVAGSGRSISKGLSESTPRIRFSLT